jgi:hypothetical protein
MKHPYLLAFAAATPLLLGAGAAQAQTQTVSPQEIQATWVGKVVNAEMPRPWWKLSGPTYRLQLKADGTSAISGVAQDTGTWHVSDKGFCITWKVIRPGAESCYMVVKDGTKVTIFNTDGSVNSTVTGVN